MTVPFISAVELTRVSGDIITVEDAFKWCRIDGYSVSHPQYTIVQSLVKTAEIEVESYLNKVIRQGTFAFYFEDFTDFDVKKYPVKSIDLVQYHDGTEFVNLDASKYEKFKYANDGMVLRYKNTSTITLQERLDAVKVVVTCGYALVDVPEYVKLAMQFLIGDWYDNRSNGKREFPTTVERMLSKYRINNFS